MHKLFSKFFSLANTDIVGRALIALETERDYHDVKVREIEETIKRLNAELMQHKDARAAFDEATHMLSMSKAVGETMADMTVFPFKVVRVDPLSIAQEMERDIETARAHGMRAGDVVAI